MRWNSPSSGGVILPTDGATRGIPVRRALGEVDQEDDKNSPTAASAPSLCQALTKRVALWVACGALFSGLFALVWLVIVHGILLPTDLLSALSPVGDPPSLQGEVDEGGIVLLSLPLAKRLRGGGGGATSKPTTDEGSVRASTTQEQDDVLPRESLTATTSTSTLSPAGATQYAHSRVSSDEHLPGAGVLVPGGVPEASSEGMTTSAAPTEAQLLHERKMKRRREVAEALYTPQELETYNKELKNNYGLVYEEKYHHKEHSKVTVDRDALERWFCLAGPDRAQKRTGKPFKSCEPGSGGEDQNSSGSPHTDKDKPFETDVCPFLTKSNVHQGWTTPRNHILEKWFGKDAPSTSIVGLIGDTPGEGCVIEKHSAPSTKYLYESCAVVGSSGNLEGSALGPEIDSQEAVFRFSCAPTVGFEDDVGSKTTFRFLYPEAMGGATDWSKICGGIIPKQDLEATIVLVTLYKEPDVNWWLSHLHRPKKFFIKTPNPCCAYSNVAHPTRDKVKFKDVRFLSPAWLESVALDHVRNLDRGTMPKQGVNGVFLALQACRTVKIYGFGSENADGSVVPHAHYYDLT
ncbi:unnamed protein product [Amoebophrya sp. A120]|nr:unnamed protein product [Amoebophrya sp. A120]|eukprot:GSA120T00003092001.1